MLASLRCFIAPSPCLPFSLSPCLLFAFAYAILDELYQELAPGRGFELADIGYDLVGIISALGLIWLRERGKANMGALRDSYG
jgi:VanZ family protein